ncbi:MAG: O-antigen ligase family protein [Planctomycetota bacterium]
MNRRAAIFLVAAVVLANAAASCLYSGEGPVADRRQSEHLQTRTLGGDLIQAIADLLTIPIPTAGIADVRDVVLLVALAAALAIVAVGRFTSHLPMRRRVPARDEGAVGGDPTECRNEGTCAGSSLSPAEKWLCLTATGVVVLSLVSTFANDSLDLSWGWIVRLAAGAGWAALVARCFSACMVRRALLALLIVAGLCLSLAVAHRAVYGLAHFTWPIGPITITAALAAVWAASAGAYAAGLALQRKSAPTLLIAALVCLSAVFVLQQTGRRAPAMGLVFAAVVAASLLIHARYPRRAVRGAIAGAFAVTATAAIVYVVAQAGSRSVTEAGPLALRFEYWRLSWELIGAHSLLGVGPDTFVVAMTNAVAPLRAFQPHFYHGAIDPYAHNEWIQAAIESGLPAALLYIALPSGIVCCAIRRLRDHRIAPQSSCDNESTSAAIVALVVGLAAIMALEAASITLRGPIMPVWFWTLLGLLTALCKPRASSSVRTTPETRPAGAGTPLSRSSSVATLALVIAAIVCLVVAAREVRQSTALARGDSWSATTDISRLMAEKTVLSRLQYTARLSAIAHADATKIEANAAAWSGLYQLIPGSRDVPARYADALLLAGRTDEARRVLDEALSERLDPFNVAANTLYAWLPTTDPMTRLHCVRRALRSGALSAPLRAILDEVLQDACAVNAFREDLPHARQAAHTGPDENAAGDTVELLRISAFFLEKSGAPREAAEDQRLAAEFYRRLEQGHSPYRRRAEAEADAFFELARLLYGADHANFRAAYDAILWAERYAVLGIGHEAVANPTPEHGFVGGEVVPTELPESLYPLWRLSALLHLCVGEDSYLDLRIYSSLPPQDRTPDQLARHLAAIARTAHSDLGTIPPERRPAHFDQLPDMARRYEREAAAGPRRR